MIEALGEGTIEGTVEVLGRTVTLVVGNVCFIPKATHRLFSTGIIEKAGSTLIQGGGRMIIFDQLFDPATGRFKRQGKPVLEAPYDEPMNLYFLFWDIPQRISRVNEVKPKSNWDLWHRRFGHISDDALRKVPDFTTGSGSIGTKVNDHPCEGCNWGKSHHQPFHDSEHRAT